MKLVSIIVPMYNAQNFIERCAESLCRQSYPNLELVFVDDGSADDTLAILRKTLASYPERQQMAQVIPLAHNQGVAHARQTGLAAVTGEFVTQIDADDYISTDYVQRMMEAASQDDVDIAVCDFVYDYGNDNMTHIHVNAPSDADECLAQIMTGQMHSGFMNKLVRHSLYTEHHLSMVPGLNIMEDKVMMLKLFTYARRIAYVPEPLYFYDKTNANSIMSQDRARQIPHLERAWTEVEQFCQRQTSTQRMTDAIEAYRIGILGSVLFYSDRPIAAWTPSLVRCPRLTDVIRQPVIPINYKVVLSCYSLHLDVVVRLLRWLKRQVKQ